METVANCISAFANVAMAAAALVGLAIAYITIRESQASQREATAKELWHDYEKMAFDNPMFASPLEHPEVRIDYEGRTIDVTGESEPSQTPSLLYERYEWYVSLLLNASEEMLQVIEDETSRYKEKWYKALTRVTGRKARNWNDWQDSINSQIGFHFPYLESSRGRKWLAEKNHYAPDFVKTVEAACDKARKEALKAREEALEKSNAASGFIVIVTEQERPPSI